MSHVHWQRGGGLNLSKFYGTDVGDSETSRGYNFGAFVLIDFGGPLSLQPEAYYTERGAQEFDLPNFVDGDVIDGAWRYDYLDFAVLLKLRVTSKQSLPSLSLFTGPVVSFRVGAKATGRKVGGDLTMCARQVDTGELRCRTEPAPGSIPYSNPLTLNTKGNDYGGTVGADFLFGLGPTRVTLDARYTRMVTEFDEAPYDDLYARKHVALSFQVGVSLNPSVWGGGRRRRVVPSGASPQNSIVMMELIVREDIAALDETLSVYEIIRLERPEWTNGDGLRATLFVDGQVWMGSPRILRDRNGAEVEEILRMVGAPGAYEEYGVVIEIVSRGAPWC